MKDHTHETNIAGLPSGSEEQQNSDRERKAERDRQEEQRKEDERAYVEQRLRELAIWERRISGK